MVILFYSHFSDESLSPSNMSHATQLSSRNRILSQVKRNLITLTGLNVGCFNIGREKFCTRREADVQGEKTEGPVGVGHPSS